MSGIIEFECLQKFSRPLMSQYGHLAVYAASNSLIVVDSQINIERLKNLLKKLDK
ncbi:MAG: hypothetical protein HAW58_06350, partial [Candidatus Thioglobus sp.]|nr:hypothetical protein [Candidatus Thioglobus sp.]